MRAASELRLGTEEKTGAPPEHVDPGVSRTNGAQHPELCQPVQIRIPAVLTGRGGPKLFAGSAPSARRVYKSRTK